jgi:uncharacterized protein YbbC (DUF1343 family)
MKVDSKTGVPVFSALRRRRPRSDSRDAEETSDVLVYDLLEVGGKTWTYVSTMALSMEAAKKKGIPFVVLDRPNPIGWRNCRRRARRAEIQIIRRDVPDSRAPRLTVGELAKLFNERHQIGADLIVIKAANWRRSVWFDETGVPWTNPSPNLRSLPALNNYPGLRLLRRH